MSDDSTASKNPSHDDEVDRIRDAFEREWKRGQRPRIEDYLSCSGEIRRAELLRQLLAVEIELRIRSGEQPRIDEYQLRFRQDPHAVSAALALREAAGPLHPGSPLARIDRYEIERELGRGTYGVVYLARDSRLGHEPFS